MPDYAEENGGVTVVATLSRTDGQRIDLERTIIVNLDLINGDAGGYCLYTYLIVLVALSLGLTRAHGVYRTPPRLRPRPKLRLLMQNLDSLYLATLPMHYHCCMLMYSLYFKSWQASDSA